MSHILLVSPPPVNQQLCATLLESGYTLAVAHDCALARQKAQHQPPLMAILALDIREKPVQTLCQWLKAQKATLVLVTANTTEERTIALQTEVDELLTYPLDVVEVQYRLQNLSTGQHLRPNNVDPLLGASAADNLGNIDLLSHDLKGPLGVITSSLELVCDFQSNRMAAGDTSIATEARLSENAVLASQRLLNLIDNMIDCARIDLNAYTANNYPLDFIALVHHVVSNNAIFIERKGLTIEVAYPATFPEVSGDADLISRIITALIDNSLKFSNQGQQIKIAFSTQGNKAILHLSDTGRAILPDYATAIFERSRQWEARQKGGRSSVALGLPFAHAAARLMQGNLTAITDLPTRTTTFTLQLPLHR